MSLVVRLFGVLGILLWRHLEELALKASYGTAYEAYRATSWF